MKNLNSQIIIYKAEDGQTKIDVRFDGDTVWLTQATLAELFQTTKQNISQHIKNIFDEGELQQNSVVKDFLTTAADGKDYSTNFYNLDLIISVGYKDILKDAGKVSHALAQELAEKEYATYYKKGLKTPSKADMDFEAFANKATKLVGKDKKKK